jgi:hypothetical protein
MPCGYGELDCKFIGKRSEKLIAILNFSSELKVDIAWGVPRRIVGGNDSG